MDTQLALKEHKTDINAGMVNSVVAAEAGGRSRVVINLTSLVPYNVSAQANSICAPGWQSWRHRRGTDWPRQPEPKHY